MMTEADNMDVVTENEVKSEFTAESNDTMEQSGGQDGIASKGDIESIKEENKDSSGDSPPKPVRILIPDHDIEVSVSSLPSLVGVHRVDETAGHYFTGVWAMNDFSHGVDGQTSEFEYKLMTKFPESVDYPASGKYTGWFHLKHPAPKAGHVKIDDKDTTLNFTKNDDDTGYAVVGEGHNKFGRFSIHGTLSEDGKFHVYKIFKKKPAHTPKVSKSLGGIKPLAPGVDVTTPRVRRPSAVLADVGDVVPEGRPRNVKQASAPTPTSAVTTSKDSGRAQRLSIPMQKCSDVLKELSKQLQAAYFREPVDYVKLCIPDYATIVKQPMDFNTIQSNLEKYLYQSHEAFAEHVRLVFKNAITFNQRRDHPVHIAAREMSNRFEEKYRMLVSQLNNSTTDFETNFRPGSLGATATGVTTGGRGRGGGARRQSSGGSGRGAGPREVSIAPPALDVNMQTLVDMQRQMKEMQTELVQIKNQLRQYDIKNSVEIQRQAAHDPMTLEEKQTLVERINRLDEERMKEIIDIIREMFPAAASGDGEDVDIPIDDLDTLTLRRLQAIVSKSEKETTKRKRSQSTTPKQPGTKRSKSTSGMAGTPKGGSKQHQLQQQAPAVVQPLHHDSGNYNANPFFGATDDDIDLLGGNDNDEPVSMDTGMPQRPVSGGTWQNVSESEGINADYSELMMEVAESEVNGGDGGSSEAGGNAAQPSDVVLRNESAWSTSVVSNDGQNSHSASNGAAWGEDVIQEKVNSQRLEENRKIEEEKARGVVKVAESIVEVPLSAAPVATEPVVDQESAVLNQRREEERRQREEMARTINLDQHREALYHTDDV